MTEYHTWPGTISFAMIHPENPDDYQGIKKWKVNFHPQDEETFKKIAESGCAREIKESTKRKPNRAAEDWGEYIALDRPVERTYGGEVKQFDPVEIQDAEGNPFGDFDPREWFNGSKVEVTVEQYNTKMGIKGTRLKRIKMIEPQMYDPSSKSEEADKSTKEEIPTKKSQEPTPPWKK